jgi:hypothetical protein
MRQAVRESCPKRCHFPSDGILDESNSIFHSVKDHRLPNIVTPAM